MKLKELIDKTKIRTGISGVFQIIVLKDENKAMSFVTNEEKFIIDASLENFNRFRKWDGIKSIADIQKTGKKVKTSGGENIPTIRIRTDIEVKEDL